MTTCKAVRFLAIVAVVLPGLGAGVTYHKMHPGCLPGLPCNEYIYGEISQTRSVFSLDAVVLTREAFNPGVPAINQKAPVARIRWRLARRASY
jgi:hypothetical protein